MEKTKPKLKELIMESLKKKNEKDEKLRGIIKQKVLEMYQGQAKEVFQDDDMWYNRVMADIHRLLKILTAQTSAIDSLERKINQLTKRNPIQDPNDKTRLGTSLFGD